jgi:ribonuclease PH
MTDKGEFIEIQGTAERKPFNDSALTELLGLGRKGVTELIDRQRKVFAK